MRKLFFFLFTCLAALQSFSQGGGGEEDPKNYTNKINIIPPSPNVASLGTYGGASADLITGAPSVSIPVYSLPVGSHSIAVAISYSSSGFKVDEAQSQLGEGWTLNAGGVVSRVIYDVPDEEAKRVFPPANIANNRREFNWFLQQANSADANVETDAQPDQFSFNFMGYSGQFILDRAMDPVLLKHANFKIEKDFSETAPWNFKITVADGTQFFFGGETAKELTRSTQSGCGIDHQEFKTTGWFLTKVVYTNGDEANLSYTRVFTNNRTSISETQYKKYGPEATCQENCPQHTNTTCISYFSHSTLLLHEIASNRSGKITFTYQSRLDASNGTDLGDYLLTTINLFNQLGEKQKSFTLEYNHIYAGVYTNQWVLSKEKNRSFLTRINEKDGLNNTIRFHAFEYDDINGLPPRLSFAQDHWGYFNGRNNTTLIPKPATYSLQQMFPSATANREVNEVYAQKGVLKKITYPTGGYEEFTYEANTVNVNELVYPSKTDAYVTARGDALGEACAEDKKTFTVPFDQYQVLYLSVSASNSTDPRHDRAVFSIKRLDNGDYLYNKNWQVGQADQTELFLQGGVSYEISVLACGVTVRGDASISYYAQGPTMQNMNKKLGGIRVKSIQTVSDPSQPIQVKTYKYAALSNLTKSSGRSSLNINYQKDLITRIQCTFPEQQGDAVGIGFLCSSYALYSNTLYNLFIYPGSNVQYEYVTESIGGENFENGGIEHKYAIQENERPNPIQGDEISGAPYSNYSIYSGRELEQLIFDKSLKKIKKTVSEYKDDPIVLKNYYGYAVNLKMSLPFTQDPVFPQQEEVDSYNFTKYEILRRWIYKSKETVYTYDQNGAETLAQIMEYEYGNPVHALPTRLIGYNSKGEKLITEFKYPSDYALVTNQTPRQSKIDLEIAFTNCDNQYNNCIGQFNTQLVSLKGDMNSIYYNCYNTYKYDCSLCGAIPCGLPDCADIINNKIKECLTNNGYYTKQNQLNALLATYNCTTSLDNCVTTALNAYNQSVAGYYAALDAATNSATDEHTKAILTMQRKWILDAPIERIQYVEQAGIQNELTRTNNKFKVWNGGLVEPQYIQSRIKTAPLETAMTFSNYDTKSNLLEFTGKDGIPNSVIWGYNKMYPVAKIVGKGYDDAVTQSGINLLIVENPANDAALRAELDKLRNLSGSLVTTYTYKPLVGATSETNPNGITVYYEYDAFGRLIHIRDKDQNILKKFCYNYYNQPEECQANTNPLWQSTGSIRCKPCPQNASYTTNMQQHMERDNNPASDTYGVTRWVDDGISGSCTSTPDWRNTATPIRCKTVGGINTGEQEQEQMDRNPCTSGGVRWVVVATNCQLCSKPANWQPTGATRCVKDANGNNTGYQERQEVDMETCSITAGQPRWVSMGIYCEQCSKPANWQPTGNYRCVKDASGNNTSEQEREEANLETCTTGPYTRWVSTGINCTSCPNKPQNWVLESVTCQLDAYGRNTGNQILVERNTEACSDAPNSTRSSTVFNTGACPLPPIYAKMFAIDPYNDGNGTMHTLQIRFFSDPACTLPLSVNNLTVNYKRVRTNCSGTLPITGNYTVTCSGTQYTVGQEYTFIDDGIHCWVYTFSVTAGTGYTAK